MASSELLRQLTESEDFVERRKTARLDEAVKVDYGQEKSGVTKDISPGGCLLQAPQELTINSEVQLQLFLGERETKTLKLKGRVVRLHKKEKNLFEYGVAFNAVNKEARQVFSEHFFTKMYELTGFNTPLLP